jgi:IS1 family transposase
MNKLPLEKRSQILACLTEGNSLRAAARLTDAAKNTVVKLLCDAGRACSAYQDQAFRNLSCKRLQVDELWSFVGAKAANAPAAKKAAGEAGDIWTWTAICAETKLVPSWYVGNRNAEAARMFIDDLASRLAHRVQLTSDGHKPYLDAVDEAFGGQIDYASLVKIYGETTSLGQRRYSPPACIGAKRTPIIGEPDPDHISTSFVERSNLTLRMQCRRFTRLTNAFSKKVENHAYAVALHFMFYNFARIHQTLRVTPAMAAGVADKVWSVTNIVQTIDAYEAESSN